MIPGSCSSAGTKGKVSNSSPTDGLYLGGEVIVENSTEGDSFNITKQKQVIFQEELRPELLQEKIVLDFDIQNLIEIETPSTTSNSIEVKNKTIIRSMTEASIKKDASGILSIEDATKFLKESTTNLSSILSSLQEVPTEEELQRLAQKLSVLSDTLVETSVTRETQKNQKEFNETLDFVEKLVGDSTNFSSLEKSKLISQKQREIELASIAESAIEKKYYPKFGVNPKRFTPNLLYKITKDFLATQYLPL